MGTNRPDIYINPSGNTTNPQVGGLAAPYRDLREWGSITADTSDKQPLIQKAIDDCIAGGYRKLYIPTIGQYHLHAPLIISSFYAGNYVAATLELFGDSTMWDSGFASYIKAEYSDSFIIGIQNGKGCTIKGLALCGQFAIPLGASAYEYYHIPFDQCTDGVCRDSRYSPNAGIVIDPFTRGNLPSDGGYPNLSSWYKGTGGTNGSTATTIEDCIIEKVVVGVCSSPNGVTRNAEITQIRNVQFKNNKLCISGGHDQEKANTVANIACWYDSHTIFATGKYGAGTAGQWSIDTVNLAGRVTQFIDNDQQGFFPTYVQNVYAEGLGRWGFMQNNTGQASTVKDCIIAFAYPESAGMQISIRGDGIFYNGCTFRYYGKPNVPIQIAGESVYTGCVFSGYPMFQGQYWYPKFVNCRANVAFLGLTGIKTFGGGNRVHPYGDWTLSYYNSDYGVVSGNDSGFGVQVKSSSQEIYTSIATDSNVAITVNGGSFSFTSALPNTYFGNQLIVAGNYWAIITGISGSLVTASYNDPSMPSGNYNITAYYPILFTGVIIGDIVSGINQIANCRVSSGYSASQQVGNVIKNPYGGSKYLWITAISGTTLFFYGSVTTTKTGAVFGNYTKQEISADYPNVNALPANYIVRRGDKIITQKGSENSIEYIVEKGGFLQGDADTRKATLAQTSGTWTGTQAQYDAIINPSDDIIYYIINTAP